MQHLEKTFFLLTEMVVRDFLGDAQSPEEVQRWDEIHLYIDCVLGRPVTDEQLKQEADARIPLDVKLAARKGELPELLRLTQALLDLKDRRDLHPVQV